MGILLCDHNRNEVIREGCDHAVSQAGESVQLLSDIRKTGNTHLEDLHEGEKKKLLSDTDQHNEEGEVTNEMEIHSGQRFGKHQVV